MKISIENKELHNIVDQVANEILFEHFFARPKTKTLDELDAVGLPGTKDKSLSGRARDMLRRRFGGRGKGLSPMGDAPESKPGFLDKVAQKLGLTRNWEKEVDKIPPTAKEKLINAFDAKAPNVSGLADGSWSPKLGDVYAYKSKGGKYGYAKVINYSVGSAGGMKVGMQVQARVLSPGRGLNSFRMFFEPKDIQRYLHGKFPDEETAKAAVMSSAEEQLQELRRKVMENLMREL